MTRPLEASLPTTPDLGTSEKFELNFNLQIREAVVNIHRKITKVRY